MPLNRTHEMRDESEWRKHKGRSLPGGNDRPRDALLLDLVSS